MARPKKKAAEARAKLMQIRLQEREYLSFKEAAELAGLDLSAWARERLKEATRRDLRKYADRDSLSDD
jgi:predicted HTH domain antitoxin